MANAKAKQTNLAAALAHIGQVARPEVAGIVPDWEVRLIARGTIDGEPGKRRHVFVSVRAADSEAAREQGRKLGEAGIFAKLARDSGMADAKFSVLPPLGLRLNGQVCKGYGSLPGATLEAMHAGKAPLAVFVEHGRKAGELVPADVAADYGYTVRGKAAKAPAKAAKAPAKAAKAAKGKGKGNGKAANGKAAKAPAKAAKAPAEATPAA